MKKTRVAINGFGRIGRMVLRSLLKRPAASGRRGGAVPANLWQRSILWSLSRPLCLCPSDPPLTAASPRLAPEQGCALPRPHPFVARLPLRYACGFRACPCSAVSPCKPCAEAAPKSRFDGQQPKDDTMSTTKTRHSSTTNEAEFPPALSEAHQRSGREDRQVTETAWYWGLPSFYSALRHQGIKPPGLQTDQRHAQ
jgi:hypothetical protein